MCFVGACSALRGGGTRASGRAPFSRAPAASARFGLLVFGIALRGHGWRITYLGADTPPESLQESIPVLAPSAVVLAVTVTADAQAVGDGLGRGAPRLAVGGRGATPGLAAKLERRCWTAIRLPPPTGSPPPARATDRDLARPRGGGLRRLGGAAYAGSVLLTRPVTISTRSRSAGTRSS